jgi:hypothetical protein
MGRRIRPLYGVTLQDAFQVSGSVVAFPELSEVDKEWLEMEKQQKVIREQAKIIVRKE